MRSVSPSASGARCALLIVVMESVGCSSNPTIDSSPTKLEGLTAIAIDESGGCALRRDHAVLCWGESAFPPRDMSTANEVRYDALAKRVSSISGATALAVGRHGCALVADGTVRCWEDGDPGITSAVMASHAPYVCAVLEDGAVQCGASGGEALSKPDIAGATSVSVSNSQGLGFVSYPDGVSICATLADGTVACWGDDTYGQLGDGTTTSTTTPVAVLGLTGVAEACVGDAHGCARLTDGSVRCWGSNAFGQLGDGTRVDNMAPVPVPSITGATSIACGQTHTCALLDDGSIQCWGSDGRGELGNVATVSNCQWPLTGFRGAQPAPGKDPSGVMESAVADCAPTPVQVQGITNAVAIAAGELTSCAVLADGSARCWGWNYASNLGDGTGADSAVPVTVLAQADQ